MVPINLDWTQFKGFVTQYALTIDYAPEGAHYFLFSSNGSVILSAYITDPTDVTDFETNYKPFAFEVSIPPGDGGPGTLVVQGTTPWACSITGSQTLPTGASTAAKQDTGNASLASIDGKTPAQGQALMAASSPVAIASNQSPLPVSQSGSWLVGAGQAGPWSVGQSGAWTIDATQSGLWSVSVSGTVAASQNGVWTVGVSGTVPISAAALPLPAGASTEATLAARNAEATQLLVKAKTDNLDVLLSTRATEATLSTRASEATLAALNTKVPSQGQAAMAASIPVAIASDQSVFSVSIGSSTGKTIVGKTATLATTATTADQVVLTYTVTSGKTLYLLGWDWQVAHTTLDHADDDFGNISLETPSGTKLQTWFARGAGKDGFSQVLSEPLPIPAGTVIRFVVTPSAVTSTTWVANVIGYEKA